MKPNAQAQTVQQLFTDKVFIIPEYQRSYAWTQKNWADFWNDLKDALASDGEHYWGTVTLRVTGEHRTSGDSDREFAVAEVVDGQQRITTIALFLLALSRCGRPTLLSEYLRTGGVDRLEPGSLNRTCWNRLLDQQPPQADLRTNRQLVGALAYFEDQIRASGLADALSKHLRTKTFVLEFVVPDERLAIRAFQSLNDRGKPLTLLEKTKSLLMYHSERYLNGDLRERINTVFGQVFVRYDLVKEAGSTQRVQYIASGKFDEDTLLQSFYHYFGAHAQARLGHADGYDWSRSAQEVFDEFLKAGCARMREEPTKLRAFIEEFLKHFDDFSAALQRLMERVGQEAPLRKMLSMLGIDALLYPLLIALEARGFLDATMLMEVERLDVRLYKVAERSNRAGLYGDTISKVISATSADTIRGGIRGYGLLHVPDAVLLSALGELRYQQRSSITKYLLWELEKALRPAFDDGDVSQFADAQLDHVWPQAPTVAFPAYGFQDAAQYVAAIDKIGNLALLEATLNARARNKQPTQKARSEYQAATAFSRTRTMGFAIENNGWTRDDIDRTTRELMDFAMARWG